MLRKRYYTDMRNIAEILEGMYRNNPHNHEEGDRAIVMYMLHKAGLLEGGIPGLQIDAAVDAFYEAFRVMADLYERNIARED